MKNYEINATGILLIILPIIIWLSCGWVTVSNQSLGIWPLIIALVATVITIIVIKLEVQYG
jgi:hypothetical protein